MVKVSKAIDTFPLTDEMKRASSDAGAARSLESLKTDTPMPPVAFSFWRSVAFGLVDTAPPNSRAVSSKRMVPSKPATAVPRSSVTMNGSPAVTPCSAGVPSSSGNRLTSSEPTATGTPASEVSARATTGSAREISLVPWVGSAAATVPRSPTPETASTATPTVHAARERFVRSIIRFRLVSTVRSGCRLTTRPKVSARNSHI